MNSKQVEDLACKIIMGNRQTTPCSATQRALIDLFVEFGIDLLEEQARLEFEKEKQ